MSLVEEPMTEHVDAGWSVREFDGIDLGDARLNRRLLTLAEAFGGILGSHAGVVMARLARC
jgi:hypothetical protein